MRTRLLVALTLCLGVALLTAEPSQAQSKRRGQPNYGPGYRPRLSPYLNLLRGGDPAANYFLGVESEVDRRAAQRTFGARINDLGKEVIRLEDKEKDVGRTSPSLRRSFEGPGLQSAFPSDTGRAGPFGGETVPRRR